MSQFKTIGEEPETNAEFYIIEVSKAEIKRTIESTVLRVFLNSNGRVAETAEQLHQLFDGYDTPWGISQWTALESGLENRIQIARPDSPIRWIAGGGLYVLNGYVVLPLRPDIAYTYPNFLDHTGGYGDFVDLLDPLKVARRELAEEIGFRHNGTLYVPNVDLGDIGSNDEFYATVIANTRKTRVPFWNIQVMPSIVRGDIVDSEVEVYSDDGHLAQRRRLLFNYDPISAGIDVLMVVELFADVDVNQMDMYFLESRTMPDGRFIRYGNITDIVLIPYDRFMEFRPGVVNLDMQIEKPGERFEGLVYNGFNDMRAEKKELDFNIVPSVQTIWQRMREVNYSPG